MSKPAKVGKWGTALTLLLAGACGQELAFPTPPSEDAPADGALDGPLDGVTGGAGEPTQGKPAKLPVAEKPAFTSFAGAGGDAPAPQPSADAAPSEAGAGGAAGAVPPPPPELLISEYVEGTSTLKALEIYALTDSSLEGCDLLTYSNGKTEPGRLSLHGELARGVVQVLCSPTLAMTKPEQCDRSTNLIFNGDDALALACNGDLLDVLGEPGVDPGESWGMGATVDHTLRRRCQVSSGRKTGEQPFDIDAEWEVFGADTFSDLGQRSCAATDSAP
jgi:hypothetical protein